jgi:hypothetical protein
MKEQKILRSSGRRVFAACAGTLFLCASGVPATAGGSGLEALRASGDLGQQRAHVWNLLAVLSGNGASDGQAGFESWYGEDQVFGADAGLSLSQGIRGFSRLSSTSSASSTAGAPVLTYTLYNAAAYAHIRANRLNVRTGLEGLRLAKNASVPEFPAAAMVLKTAWWPVAADRVTALPVWDPEANPARRAGNPYTTWQRAVAVDPQSKGDVGGLLPLEFAGRSFDAAHRVGINAFHHVVVSREMARRLMRDSDAKKLSFIALGRPLQEGDYLVLVGANLASREISDWVWAAFWWHDQSAQGEFAAGRPESLRGVWRNYLMQTAFDPVMPQRSDGSAHICFNPWLEARFPDAGEGGGTQSNCMACHARASFPASSFLPVTRGAALPDRDPAYASNRLRTSLLWSLTLHAGP